VSATDPLAIGGAVVVTLAVTVAGAGIESDDHGCEITSQVMPIAPSTALASHSNRSFCFSVLERDIVFTLIGMTKGAERFSAY
jgi:hypothetical protein